MDTFEFNKIAGALLFTLLLILGSGFLAELLYTPPALVQQAYVVEVPEEGEAAHGEEPEEEELPLAVVLADGDADKGASVAKKCSTCHAFEEGATKPPTGPNLHGVVGRQVAAVDGFDYSESMRALGGEWTYERLYDFLEAPKQYVEKTKMAFAGLKKTSDRADIIAFLRSVTPGAPPLPEPEPAADQAAASEDAPAAEETPAAEEAPATETPAEDSAAAESPAQDSAPDAAPANDETPPGDAGTSDSAAEQPAQ